MRSIMVVVCCLLALILSTAAFAGVREASVSLVSKKQHNLMREASNSEVRPPFPDEPFGKQVYLIAYMGATYRTVLAIGPHEDDAVKLAEILDKWQAAQGLSADVTWSQDDDSSAAQAKCEPTSHIGLMAAESSLPFGSAIQAFRQAGYDPVAVGRIGSYADLDGAGKPFLTTASKLIDLRSLEPNARITVQAEAPAFLQLGFVLWLAFVPVMTLVGFAVAYFVGSRKSIPIERRRVLYPKIALGTCFIGIALHFISFIAFIATGSMAKVVDLWFGSSTLFVVTPFLAGGPLVLIPLIFVTRGIERRLFGPDPEREVTVPAQSLEERAYHKKKAILVLGISLPLLCLYFAMSTLTPRTSVWRELAMIPFALGIFGSLLIRPLIKGGREFETGEIDEIVSGQAADLARKMGIRAGKVKVMRSAFNQAYILATLSTTGITLSQAAVDKLDKPELDFLLAHELAHQKNQHIRKGLLAVLPAIIPIVGVQFYVFNSQPPHPTWVVPACFSVSMLYVAVLFFSLPKAFRNRELEADLLALKTTGSLASAISCLEKCALNSPMPHMHDISTSRHPAIETRIAVLRAHSPGQGRNAE